MFSIRFFLLLLGIKPKDGRKLSYGNLQTKFEFGLVDLFDDLLTLAQNLLSGLFSVMLSDIMMMVASFPLVDIFKS